MIFENALPEEWLAEKTSCAHSGIENTKNPLLAFKQITQVKANGN